MRLRLDLRKPTSGWRLYAAVAAVYLGLALLWTLPVWFANDRLIGRPTDPVSYAWGAAWVPFALTHGLNPFFTHYMNAPAGANYMWPAPVLVYDLIAWPLTDLVSAVIGYNSIIIVGLVTTGCATFVLFHRFSTRLWLVLLTSAMFTFGPYMAAETIAGHPDLIAVGVVPLLALALHELFIRQQWPGRRLGLLLGTLAVVQMVTSEEVLASSILVFGIGALILVGLSHGLNGRSGKYIMSALKWSLFCVPILLGYAVYQWLEPGALHGLNAPLATYAAPPLSFFLPGNTQMLSPTLTSSVIYYIWSNKEELGSYIGIPLALFMFWAAAHRPTTKVKWLLWMTVVCAILALGPYLTFRGNIQIPGPEYLVTLLPLWRDLLPIRLTLYLDLFVTAFLLFAFDNLHFSQVRQSLLLAVLALVWMPTVFVTYITIPTPRFFVASTLHSMVRPNSTMLVLPYVAGGATDGAMLWQAESRFGFQMPEGYWVRLSVNQSGNAYGPAMDEFNSSLYEVSQTGRVPTLTTKREDAALAYLRTHGVQTVILGPGAHELQLKQYVENFLLGKHPISVGGVFVWRFPGSG